MNKTVNIQTFGDLRGLSGIYTKADEPRFPYLLVDRGRYIFLKYKQNTTEPQPSVRAAYLIEHAINGEPLMCELRGDWSFYMTIKEYQLYSL